MGWESQLTSKFKGKDTTNQELESCVLPTKFGRVNQHSWWKNNDTILLTGTNIKMSTFAMPRWEVFDPGPWSLDQGVGTCADQQPIPVARRDMTWPDRGESIRENISESRGYLHGGIWHRGILFFFRILLISKVNFGGECNYVGGKWRDMDVVRFLWLTWIHLWTLLLCPTFDWYCMEKLPQHLQRYINRRWAYYFWRNIAGHFGDIIVMSFETMRQTSGRSTERNQRENMGKTWRKSGHGLL